MYNGCCGFTGFRPERFPYKYNEKHPECMLLKQELYGKIIQKCCIGVHTFYTGMAMGSDIWAAEAVLDIKNNYFYNINLVAVIPFCQHDMTLKPWYRERYNKILNSCYDIIYTNEEYRPDSYCTRNKYIVEHCDHIIAVYDEKHPILRSGTGSTVRYAKQLSRDITFIHPQSTLIA